MNTTFKTIVILFVAGCSDTAEPSTTVMVDCQRTADADSVTVDCGNNGNENTTYYGDAPTEDEPDDGPVKILWGQQCPQDGSCPAKECFVSMCVDGQCASIALEDGQTCLFSIGTCLAGICQVITPG